MEYISCLGCQAVEIVSALASSTVAAFAVLAPALMSTCVSGEHQHALGLAHAARYSYAPAALMHGALAALMARILSWLFDGVGADARDAQFLGGGDDKSACEHRMDPKACPDCKEEPEDLVSCYHGLYRVRCLKVND